MNRVAPVFVLASWTLAAGCPESAPPPGPAVNHAPEGGPPPGTPGLQPGNGPRAAQSGAAGTSPAPSVMDAQTFSGPGTGGVFAGDIPVSELTPRHTQEELKDGTKVSGTLVCKDCSGQLLVRVLPPPPEAGAGGGPPEISLITSKVFGEPGPFDILVPADEGTVVLQVVDDANSDGKPSAGERMGMPKTGPVSTETPTTGLALEVGSFPERPATDPMGNPLSATAGPPKATEQPPNPGQGAPPSD